ncbi:glycosyltransferase [Candidatus Peregrinibacteria bacterium]|nr:glycosyltransferase [Candidatus Peregrinibacteria bacterium]
MNELGIVILHFNTPQDVEKNLKAISKADIPAKTEIVVVNNGGHDANKNISGHSYKNLNVKFFDIPNKGFPQGNNFGISKLNSEYIAMVNPDVEIEKDTFKILLDYFKKHPQVGIIAPRLIYPNGKTQDNYRVFPRPFDLIIKRISFLRKRFVGRMRKYLMWDKSPEQNEQVDWLTGAFQVITKKCWDKCGPNNEYYFLFMSDVELCRKAWQQKFEVHYVGHAKARHNESRLSEGGIQDIFKKKTMRIHITDAVKYFIKYLFRKHPNNCPSCQVKQKA